jgi:ATP-dependent exoDNAse (exonuclease V) beta subunit
MTRGKAAPPHSVHVVGASAGTGKTSRLVTTFADAVYGADGKPPIDASAIVVTTFTNKAADEITDRIRQQLISDGHWEAAQYVLTGYIGTVNSVCGRIIAEFALDAGLSPVIDVLPEERTGAAFAAAAEPVVSAYMQDLDPIAHRLSQDKWRDLVLDICRMTRSNGIGPGDLSEFATRSWHRLRQLLPQSDDDAEAERLDTNLSHAINQAITSLSSGIDSTQATAKVLDDLKECAAVLRSGEYLRWSDWARLSKVKPGKSSESAVSPVRAAACCHPKHPRLHEDLRRFIELVFACAASALEHYQVYKRQLAFLDFTDQEALALRLLNNKEVAEQLRSKLSLVLVDEFQDTSPIQLAIFLKLARIAEKSVWVGDEKQAIYGFRDTDPELMHAVVRAVVPQSGGSWDRLSSSYRTVPELVKFTNDVFSAAFPPLGINAEQTRIDDCKRASLPGGRNLHAWWLPGKNWEEAVRALAAGVHQMLARPADWPVVDPGTNTVRPLQGGDIAILCRRNERCIEVATALAEIGIPVAASRRGLLATPECALAFACLRYLVDSSDTLAAAEIMHFTHEPRGNHSWLVDVLEKGLDQVIASMPQVEQLARQRPRLGDLTPGEAVELALMAGGVLDTVATWVDSRQRLSNLNALRALAIEYEELCLAQRSAATAAGFVTFLLKNVEHGGEQPPNPDEHAVRVLTYHGAKGLEWPVVILADLGTPRAPSVFGATVEPPEDGFDPWEPLRGRSIRLWPWPYGAQEKGVYLDATADACDEMARARARDHAENVRLLYVGATRARDYLILACRDGKDGTSWLDSLTDAEGRTVLALPTQEGIHTIRVSSNNHTVHVRRLETPEQEQRIEARPRLDAQEVPRLRLRPETPFEHPPLRLPPSRASAILARDEATMDSSPDRVISIGGRLPIAGSPDMAILGEAVHRFLSADDPDWDTERRTGLAREILRRWHVVELDGTALIEASDRLLAFLNDRYPAHRRYREYPVHGRVGLQRVSGRIDLLVETDDGFVIIDHKTFPGSYDHWVDKAFSYRPQLLLYGELIRNATGCELLAFYVHMPIVGKIIDVV